MNWADECSDSDSDTGGGAAAAAPFQDSAKAGSAVAPDLASDLASDLDSDSGSDAPPPQAPPRRVYAAADLPSSRPPFTAFVGNLPFSIKEGEQLADGIRSLLAGLGPAAGPGQGDGPGDAAPPPPSAVLDGRLVLDRATGRSRGYGYVELGTAEDLVALLNLPPDVLVLGGRGVRFDVATSQRGGGRGGGGRRGGGGGGGGRVGDRGGLAGSIEGIDGSKFRGGFPRGDGGRGRGRGGGGGGRGRGGRGGGPESGPPKQRQSLKLAPRSVSAEVGASTTSSSSSPPSSDIFGSARPRDGASWQASGTSASGVEGKGRERQRSGGGKGKGGRGGEGRGEGRRQKSGGGKKGGSDMDKEIDRDRDRGGSERPPAPATTTVAAPAPAPAPAPSGKKQEKKVINSFAALGFDSDSD